MPDSRTPAEEPPAWRITATLLGVVVLGVPLVAFLWETVNETLSLHVDATRLLLSIPLLALWLALLWAAARFVRRA